MAIFTEKMYGMQCDVCKELYRNEHSGYTMYVDEDSVKEEAFEAMKNGAIISHKAWGDGKFIREIDGVISDEDGTIFQPDSFDKFYNADKWLIVRPAFQIGSYQAEQLLKAIPLHLEDPNRVWCYSGHEAEPAIEKVIRNIHEKVERLEKENEVLKDQVESLRSAVIAKDEVINVLKNKFHENR